MNKYEIAIKRGYKVDLNGNVFNPNGYKLDLHLARYGYYVFNIRIHGKTMHIPVHKLISYNKFGIKSIDKEIHTRHLDGNPLNNNWNNIAIGSCSDNMMDKPKQQRVKDASNPKYNHKMIIFDRNNGMSYKDLMKKYNISSKGTLSFIINKSLEKSNI